MKKVIRIDSEGFFVSDVILEDSEVTSSDCIENPCPEGFFNPKWNGEVWTEGATQEYIYSVKNQLVKPTAEERISLLEQALDEILLGGGL